MTWLDNLISWVSPAAGLRRSSARRALQLSSGYRAARRGRLEGGRSVIGTPDHHLEIGYDRRDMVDRARRLQRDNALADGILQRATENIIGRGIRAQATTASAEWNQKAEELFREWSLRSADVRGLATFDELQRLIFRSYLTDGDVGVIKLGGSEPQLQVVTSGLLASPLGRERSDNFRDGVELDARGRPTRFHIVRNVGLLDKDPRLLRERSVVSAADFIFLARRVSADQTRGLPVLAQTERLFDQIDGLIESVIVAARMAACFGLVVKTPFGPEGLALDTGTGADGNAYPIENFEPGSVKYLEIGEEIDQIKPSHPGTNFSEFLSTLGRLLGMQLGMPLELIFMDFSKTNFSSARAALIQAQRAFRCQQQYFIHHFLTPVWEWLITRWVAEGKLRPRADMLKVDWVPEGWQWIDPLKSLQGELLAMDMGVTDLGSVIRSQGGDFAEMLARRRDQLEKLREAGLPVVRSTATRDPVQPGTDKPIEPETEPQDPMDTPPGEDNDPEEREDSDEVNRDDRDDSGEE